MNRKNLVTTSANLKNITFDRRASKKGMTIILHPHRQNPRLVNAFANDESFQTQDGSSHKN